MMMKDRFFGHRTTKARRVLRRVKLASLKVVVTLTTQERMQAVITGGTKVEAWNEKERARKVLVLNLVFQTRKHPAKKEIASPGNQMIGMTILLIHLLYVVHLHGMARDILPGCHQSL